MFQRLPGYGEPQKIKSPPSEPRQVFIGRPVFQIQGLADKRFSSILSSIPEILEEMRRLVEWCLTGARQIYSS